MRVEPRDGDGRKSPCGPSLAQLADEFNAVNRRHGQVGHDGVNSRLLIDVGKGRGSVASLHNVSAAASQER